MKADEFLVEYNPNEDPNDHAADRYDPASDEFNAQGYNKTRKDELTLKKLNRLKKIRAVKKLEALKRQKLLGVLYGSPKEEGGPEGGSPF